MECILVGIKTKSLEIAGPFSDLQEKEIIRKQNEVLYKVTTSMMLTLMSVTRAGEHDAWQAREKLRFFLIGLKYVFFTLIG